MENTVAGHLRGFRGNFFLTPIFSGKDFWCAEYVDCTAKNAMMLSFTILEVILDRVNVFGLRGKRGKRGSGPLTGFSG